MAALDLHCSSRAFPSCSEWGAALHCSARASHCGVFSCRGTQVLCSWTSVLAARGGSVVATLGLWSLDLPRGSGGKESVCNAGDLCSILGVGRSPGGGHDNPLQYSCLENRHGQKSLADYSPRGCKESDATKHCTAQGAGSVVVTQGLSCPGSKGNLPRPGIELCPLHWQVDSLPPDHQGSPSYFRNQKKQNKTKTRLRVGNLQSSSLWPEPCAAASGEGRGGRFLCSSTCACWSDFDPGHPGEGGFLPLHCFPTPCPHPSSHLLTQFTFHHPHRQSGQNKKLKEFKLLCLGLGVHDVTL